MGIEVPAKKNRGIVRDGEVSKIIEIGTVVHDVMIKVNKGEGVKGECENNWEETGGSF